MLGNSDLERKWNRILFGPQLGALLFSVIDLKIAQILSQGPKTIEELSQITLTNKNKLERALFALESYKIFDYDTERKEFLITSLSGLLLKDEFTDLIKLATSPWMFELLGAASNSLKLNKTSPELRYNITWSDFLGQRKEILNDFVEAETADVKMISDLLIPAIDLRNSHKVLEIGGHCGALTIELAKAYKHFNGVVYDQTLYHQNIEKKIHECHLSDRIKVSAGNYVDTVPEGFDTVLMKCLATEYNDEDLDKILRNIRSSLNPGSKFYFIDVVVDRSHKEYKFERLVDIIWWHLNDGKVRSRNNTECFLNGNGFRIVNQTCAKNYFVIETMVV